MTSPLISICIPTYNRAISIKRLLDKLVPQVSKVPGEVEICISNNCSTDDTRDVILGYKKEHDDLINYNENDENLGFDRNLLKAISLARGRFVWLFGDDDSLIDDGVERVLEFIKGYGKDDVGLLVLRRESFLVDERTGKRTVYGPRPFDEGSRVIKLKNEDVRYANFPDNAFISVQIFNNAHLRKIIKDEEDTIKEVFGLSYMHMLLYRLMFLRIPGLKSYYLNKIIVLQEVTHFKFIVEAEFKLTAGRTRIENLLMSRLPPSSNLKPFKEHLMNLKVQFILRMFYMRCYDIFNYDSYLGCIKNFFDRLSVPEALMLTAAFMAISVTPSSMAKRTLKPLFKMRFKKDWKANYLELEIIYGKVAKGDWRREY